MPKARFTTAVRPDTSSEDRRWGRWDAFALASIPAILLSGFLLHLTPLSPLVAASTDSVFRLFIGAALIFGYAPMFRAHWAAVKRAPWRSAAVVLAGAIGLQVAIAITRQIMNVAGIPLSGPAPSSDVSADTSPDPLTASWPTLAIIAFVMLSPNITVFIEEVVFRYTLLAKLPVWGNALKLIAATLANSILFGLIHYWNFNGGIVDTIPYMFAGLLMNLVFIWTRNAWLPALMHLVNNATLTYGGLALIIILRLLGVETGA
ncbi:CAAX amino terminal protease self- immunity [Corynebacterium atrinae]|uniref:CPBP family intramembrane glutamic endopeptidase n=1 Tax=Corynebacterium atrinae TaxID=1336740 RepID=UPI0025B550DF|nr:type II CAAX endopeptidase family protein [Corynebacterium atrinae]WJY62210.1 CAAX amino terminal protease self- immunity [Corynebacterium atrinae]